MLPPRKIDAGKRVRYYRRRLTLKDDQHLQALRALVRTALAKLPNAEGLSAVKRRGKLEIYVEEKS